MAILVHETTINNFKNIVTDGFLKKPSDLVFFEICNGCNGRRRTKDPSVSLWNKKFYEDFDEVDGVYFRPVNTQLLQNYNKQHPVLLVFDADIIRTTEYNFNSVENNGFMISSNFQTGVAQICGDIGFSVWNYPDVDKLFQYFNNFNSEIVLLNSVQIDKAVQVYINNEFKTDIHQFLFQHPSSVQNIIHFF